MVFGAITGVGIWWTIGLASPLATEVLIRTFLFGWATEYVCFLVEIVAAFVFYYYWGRLTEKAHVTIGWIYAIAAWLSLVLITGITAFMVSPGVWLDPEHHTFWNAFFNPQFLPQTVARTGGALLLSSLYIYLHASLATADRRLHDLVAFRSSRPALLGAALVTFGGVGWYVFLPESARAALEAAAVLTVFTVLIFALTAVVFVLLYLGPYRNPGWLSPGFAGALCLFGIAAFSAGEFIREAVRKPYILYNVVLGNQVYPDEIASLRDKGYLEGGIWTREFVHQRYPKDRYPTMYLAGGEIDRAQLIHLPIEDRKVLGEVLFQYHCNDCHAEKLGYSAVAPMIRGWSRERIESMVEHLDEEHFFMPPWAGTPEEAQLLTEYLLGISAAPPERYVSARAASRGRSVRNEGGALMETIHAGDLPPLPAPFWFIEVFKVLGFTLHMMPMNLWYAGLLVAIGLHFRGGEHGRRFGYRLMRQMPVIIAIGINFGIVPLLFLQVAYSRAFYPATILMAWFWLAIIVLLIFAYYGTYGYVFGLRDSPAQMPRWRRNMGWAAAACFIAIGFLFANGLSLTTRGADAWRQLWLDHNIGGAATGVALNVSDPTLWPRWLLMFGFALITTAAWMVVDGFWIALRESDEYRRWVHRFALRLALIGAAWATVAGSFYLALLWRVPQDGPVFSFPWIFLTLVTAVSPWLPWGLLFLCHDRFDRLKAAAVGTAQFAVLGLNAITRQVVQNLELHKLFGDAGVSAQPVTTQWGPVFLFLASFAAGTGVVAWILAQVARASPSPPSAD